MDTVNYDCEEILKRASETSRRIRSARNKVLRETLIRSIHHVEELKGAQEIGLDEFSSKELSESDATNRS